MKLKWLGKFVLVGCQKRDKKTPELSFGGLRNNKLKSDQPDPARNSMAT